MDDRFTAMEDKMDRRFVESEARIVALENKMDTRIGRLEGVLITQQKAS